MRASAAVGLLAVLKVGIHLATAGRYGIFRDELYYLARARHLAWGYVDHPPLIALMTWVAMHLFGTSLLGLRVLPALAGGALVWMAAQVARELGGGRFAQMLAAFAVIPVPIYLILDHWLTMNAFEPLLWTGVVWAVVRMLAQDEPRYWVVLGALVGVGMENKYSIALLACGLVVGLLLTPQRRLLWNWWFAAGVGVATVLFLPNLVWLWRHGFPFLEFERHSRMAGSRIVRGPAAFLWDQALLINPVVAPLALAGVVWLVRERRFRAVGWAVLFVTVALMAVHGKNYYLSPMYAAVIAAGAVWLERVTKGMGYQLIAVSSELRVKVVGATERQLSERDTSPLSSQRARGERGHPSFWGRSGPLTHTAQGRRNWVRVGYVGAMATSGLVLAPLVMPILAVPRLLAYERIWHGFTPVRIEALPDDRLPQYFADEFGWEQMVQETAAAFHRLPREEQARTAIFANNYGEAGAIDFFGPKYGLPAAISKNETYWLWGPRGYTGDEVLVLGSDGKGDREHFRSVETVGTVDEPNAREIEHFDVYLCRGLNGDLRVFWPKLKAW